MIVTIGLLVGRSAERHDRGIVRAGTERRAPTRGGAPERDAVAASAARQGRAGHAQPERGGGPSGRGEGCRARERRLTQGDRTRQGRRARARRATDSPQKKRHTARPSRSKHTRLVAHESTAAPKAADDERSARASYERGNQRLLTGDTAAAISAYEEAVRSAPSSPSGYRGLGLAYEKEGKIAEAVRAFRRYLKLAPSSGDRDLVARRLRHLLRPGTDPGK